MSGERGGRASSGLTALVIATYGNRCHLRMPGCLGLATTKDHLIPYSHGGTNTLDNLRPACKRCNSKRQNRVLSGWGATINVVIGPPAAGKSTYVLEHAKPADVVIDLDVLARALMPIQQDNSHVYPDHVRHVAIGARKAAIDRATRLAARCTVWVVHAIPSADTMAEYKALRYRIITVDPGREVVEQRARTMRPSYMWPAVARWYSSGLASVPMQVVPTASSSLAIASSSSQPADSSAADW